MTTRRDLLKQGALGAAGLVVASACSSTSVQNLGDAAAPDGAAPDGGMLPATSLVSLPYSYVCYKATDADTTWRAWNTVLGRNELSTNDPSALLQSAIDQTSAAGGGRIFIRGSQYWGTTAQPLNLRLKSNVYLEGEGIATRLYGRIVVDNVGFTGLRHVFLVGDKLPAGAPLLRISNSRQCVIEDCKLRNVDSLSDPLIKIDDDDGGVGKYTSGIYVRDCYFQAPYRCIHINGTTNHVHVSDSTFSQSTAMRSTNPNNCAIFIEQNSPARFTFGLSFNRLYLEDFYAGIYAQKGWWTGNELWFDDLEYGVVLGPDAVLVDKAIRFDGMHALSCAYLAKINGVNQGSGPTTRRFVYESGT